MNCQFHGTNVESLREVERSDQVFLAAGRVEQIPSVSKKKTGLVGPVSSGVELRCGYITTRRELATRFSGQFDQKCHCDPRAS